jgi:hypothetical protein
MEAPVEASMEVVVEAPVETVMEAMMEMVVPAEQEDATSEESRTAVVRIPIVRITIVRITIVRIADTTKTIVSVGWGDLYGIAVSIHALRVRDIVARLNIVFAGGCVVGTDRGATCETCPSANRRTGARIPGGGANGGPRRRPNQSADGGTADGRLASRLSGSAIADRRRCAVAARRVLLLKGGGVLSGRGKRHYRWAQRRLSACRSSTHATEARYQLGSVPHDLPPLALSLV